MRRLAAVLLALGAVSTAPAEELYAPLPVQVAKARALEWARTRPDYNPDADSLLSGLWELGESESTPGARLDAALRTFYLVDPQARELIDACVGLSRPSAPLDFAALHTGGDHPFYANNLRAFYARYLAVLRMYDESLEIGEQVDPAELIDPASFLFYKAVAEHSLLHRDEGLATITILLENTEDVPIRYSSVAELMKHDLEQVREKTLGEVARQMRDVERRLELGRAGQRVQHVEERIIATLDEIIEKMEQQQGGGGGGGQGQSRGNQSNSPADESYVGGSKAPGEVDPKPIGHEAGWGNLPEKEQAQAKIMMDKLYPPHYKQIVEEYSRRLAQRPASRE